MAVSSQTSCAGLRELGNIKKKFEKRTLFCPRHDEVLRYFCEKPQCQTIICKDCTIADYRDIGGHRITSVEKIVTKYENTFRDAIKSGRTELDQILKIENKISEQIDENEERREELENEVNAIYNELIAHITAERERIKFKLRKAFQMQINAIEKVHSQIKTDAKQLKQACTLNERAVDEGSQQEFMSVRNVLSGRLEEFTSRIRQEPNIPKIDFTIRE
uniref:E3 ubiquitin-protein ligase TRIM41-like n=1 Tax=Saccoglossus kowalevskii TaxID=10224 RepID=A0ABM0LWE7_SACKO|nr:PREDICTED: E3 ubiquitin-protein ligase TRIM41-like [Saccoglossus kowalevskii]